MAISPIPHKNIAIIRVGIVYHDHQPTFADCERLDRLPFPSVDMEHSLVRRRERVWLSIRKLQQVNLESISESRVRLRNGAEEVVTCLS